MNKKKTQRISNKIIFRCACTTKLIAYLLLFEELCLGFPRKMFIFVLCIIMYSHLVAIRLVEARKINKRVLLLALGIKSSEIEKEIIKNWNGFIWFWFYNSQNFSTHNTSKVRITIILVNAASLLRWYGEQSESRIVLFDSQFRRIVSVLKNNGSWCFYSSCNSYFYCWRIWFLERFASQQKNWDR